MDSQTVKHLEFIESAIARMARNSFAYKGWGITLVVAVSALAAKEKSPEFVIIALLPTLAFWGLDAYYLRQERLFIKLYNAVRDPCKARVNVEIFSMETKEFDEEVGCWLQVLWSKSERCLYGPLVLLIILATAITAIFN